MAQTKATKKFEARHLKDTLKARKDFSKIKQRHQVNAKRKAKRAGGDDGVENDAHGEGPPAKKQKQEGDHFQDMSVDDFFANDLPVPEPGSKAKSKQEPAVNAESLRKRKRRESDKGRATYSSGSEEDDAVFDDLDAGEEAAANGEEGGLHTDELKALAAKDPEFFKYLQENDAELLDFAENVDLDEVAELSGSDENIVGTKKGKDKKRKKTELDETDSNISIATVQKWKKAMTEKHSLRAMREVVLAFRAAAHLDEEGKQYKYTISNADVYHEVVSSALKHVPSVLNHHLPIKEMANGKMRIPTDLKKFRTLTPLLKSHTVSLQHLLTTLSDASALKPALTSILSLTPYMLSFKKAVRELIRTVVDLWSDSANDEAVRISAFLILRRLAVISDAGTKDTVLRSTYQGFIKGSRATTIHTISGINLMKNSALELWALVDANLSYTTAFTFIRQLSIHLRNSIKNNANDSYKTVYNWQYIHSLDFWSRTLSTNCETLREAMSGKESPLRPLIYPLTQVTLGAMRLIPTSAYFPLRFQLVRSLIRLSAATSTFIPLATPLYEVLTSAEMKKPPKPATLKPLEWETSIRASKSYLRTRVYQDGIGEQVVELLGEFLYLWCRSVAFPELALPVCVMLRRWVKEVAPFHSGSAAGGRSHQQTNGTGLNRGKKSKAGKIEEQAKGNRNTRLNTAVSLLVQKVEANARFIEEKRAKVEFAPNNRGGVEGFLKETEAAKTPLGAFVEGQRKAKEESRRVLEEGRREEERRRESARHKDGTEKDVAFENDEDEGGSSGEDDDGALRDEDENESEMEDGDDEVEGDVEVEDERELEDDEIEVLSF